MHSQLPRNASFDMRLDMFFDENSHLSHDEKKVKSFGLHLKKGIQIREDVSTILEEILITYKLEGSILVLRNPTCEKCNQKLRKKELIQKTFPLPGGNNLILTFQGYYCEVCNDNKRLNLPRLFQKGDRYPSYVKGEAVRLYEEHLSSYDAAKGEIKTLFGRDISKRTTRLWIKSAGVNAEKVILTKDQFSGYFAYDEEFVKVFSGNVGIRGAKLTREENYVYLLRDTITKNSLLSIEPSLLEENVEDFLTKMCIYLIEIGAPIHVIVTDGKREYNSIVNGISKKLINAGLISKPIKHAYCVFHFKKGLYEIANESWFGNKNSKEDLPNHILNQIRLFDSILDAPSKEVAEANLNKFIFEQHLFLKPLQKQLLKLQKYKEEYLLQITYPQIRTTDVAENFFSITKPTKIKHEYKTSWGLNAVLQTLKIKKSNKKWLNSIGFHFNFRDSLSLLLNSFCIMKDE
jgi:hypothetical protein